MFTRLIREPLIHFLLIGAALFGISWMVRKNDRVIKKEDSEVIVVDSTVRSQLVQAYEQHTGQAPSPLQTDSLIARYVQREMLYREALSVGLDKNNDSLKTILANQMSIAYMGNEVAAPTDEQLKALLKDDSWYANDSGISDTSEVLFSMMKRQLKNRYQQLEKEKQAAQKMKTLASKYKIVISH